MKHRSQQQQGSNWPIHHNPANYCRYSAGEEVSIFYRNEYDGSGDGAEAYFPVKHGRHGQAMPRLGKTECWQPAVVVEDFSPESFDIYHPMATGVRVRLQYPLWYNRHGNLLDCSSPKNTEVRIHPADMTRGPPPKPKISFVVLRWGGHYKTPDYNELAGEEGGWGSLGTSISDGYIRAVFERMYQRLGCTYEVLCCYVASAADLGKVTANVVLPLLDGELKSGCYFLWPVASTDGTSRTPGYVEKTALFDTMKELELGGITTAFPHSAGLYKLLVSKDWCSYVCTNPELRTPATTKVMRSSIEQNAEIAAGTCLSALSELTFSDGLISRGVAKLGYSWEASDVLSFSSKWDLAKKLETLLNNPGCEADHVIAQEFVPSDLEVRVYCIGGIPVKMLYTKFCENTEDGSFTSFKSVSRDAAIGMWFGGNEVAMCHAEAEMCVLTKKWMKWVRGVDCKLPSFLRIDYFVKREGSSAVIRTGEITEAGASCLGWAEGWTATFDAVIHAATGTPFPQLLTPLNYDIELPQRLEKAGSRGKGGHHHHHHHHHKGGHKGYGKGWQQS